MTFGIIIRQHGKYGKLQITLFGGIYTNKKVLITGYTGFKGSWLSLWLTMMGAKVYGYALAPPSNPNHIEALRLKY